ncbi:MAG: nitroreductase family deazaflavin-dependent oxidoreductase [Acidimicrobiia bacterium]
MKDSAVRRWSRVHSAVFKLTRGRMGKRLVENDILLLTTTGRKTGEPHTVPLLYLVDDDRYVVIASYGGRPHHPEWYLNLAAEPRVVVRLPGRTVRMLARTATPEEREEWWPRIVDAYQGYAVYQSRTDREIPVVFLEPQSTGSR